MGGARGALRVLARAGIERALALARGAAARDGEARGGLLRRGRRAGGLVDEAATKTFGLPSYNDNIERLLAARDVMMEDRARFVLLSGGSWDESGTAEAAVLGRQLEAWGVAHDRVVVEGRSRNTRENAVESAKIIAERGWRRVLLVTSAFHMRRALGCFRAAGLDQDVMSVDFRSCYCPFSLGQLLPRSSALDESTAALRERFGRLVYRARGYATAVP